MRPPSTYSYHSHRKNTAGRIKWPIKTQRERIYVRKEKRTKEATKERKIAGGGVRRRAIEVLLNLYVRREQRNWGRAAMSDLPPS